MRLDHEANTQSSLKVIDKQLEVAVMRVTLMRMRIRDTQVPPLRKCLLLHPATPYYTCPRGKLHTRGNIWSFTVG